MNPITVALAVYLFWGFDAALRGPLALGNTAATPSFMMVLLVFLAVHGPVKTVPWVGLALGLCVDLLVARPIYEAQAIATIIGPNAIGFFAASHAVLALRGLMLRRNPFAFLFLCAAGTMLAQLVVVAIMTLRSLLDTAMPAAPSAELLARAGSAVYTGVISLVLGPLLHLAVGWFGFADPFSRRSLRR